MKSKWVDYCCNKLQLSDEQQWFSYFLLSQNTWAIVLLFINSNKHLKCVFECFLFNLKNGLTVSKCLCSIWKSWKYLLCCCLKEFNFFLFLQRPTFLEGMLTFMMTPGEPYTPKKVCRYQGYIQFSIHHKK